MSRYWQTLAIVTSLGITGAGPAEWYTFLFVGFIGFCLWQTYLACKREDAAATRSRTLT